MLAGHRPSFGGISFGLAANARQGLKVLGVLVGETDLGPFDLVRIPHPGLEVLAAAAGSEEREGPAPAALDHPHPIDLTSPQVVLLHIWVPLGPARNCLSDPSLVSPPPKKVQIRAGFRDPLVLLPNIVRAVHAEAGAQAVAELLGYRNLNMTLVYARVANRTVADHFEAVVFETGPEFLPILRKQRDHVSAHRQIGREDIYERPVAQAEEGP